MRPMSKKGFGRTLAVLLIVAVGYVALTECRPGRPTSFNFWRIETGMSRGDVEAILGPGAGLHEGDPTIQASHTERLIVPGQPAADIDQVLRWVATDFG